MIYDHLTPTGHPLPRLGVGQIKQTCPKDQALPKNFVDNPKPNYLPGVEPEPPPPETNGQAVIYEQQEGRFLPITLAVLAIRAIIALVKRVP